MEPEVIETKVDGLTARELMDEECAKVGVELTDEEVEHVLWAHTGYPCFWSTSETNPTPEACLRAQVREWAEHKKSGAPDNCEEEMDRAMERVSPE